MKGKICKRKKSQSTLLATVLSLIILTSGIMLTTNSTLINSTITGSAIQSGEILNTTIEGIIEKTAEVEVWADTSIDIKASQNSIWALLLLDNGTALPNREIQFYLNGSLIESKITNSESYAELMLNPYNVSPGIYSIKAEFQGDSSLYLNPSSIERQIEIIEQNGTKQIIIIEADTNITAPVNETNQSLLNVYTDKTSYIQNETINIFGEIIINGEKVNKEIVLEIEFNETKILTANISSIEGNYVYSLIANFENEGEYLVSVFLDNLSAQTSFYFTKTANIINLEGYTCKEFEDNILWSSGYTHSKKGSTEYQTWNIGTNCSEIGEENCFLKDVSIDTRGIYVSPYEVYSSGEGYVQISNPDESICDNPENGVYSRYLSYDIIEEIDTHKRGWHCGKKKNSRAKCGMEAEKNFDDNVNCYGIKVHGSQYFIVDVFKVKYKLCWESSDSLHVEGEENE